MNVVDASVVFTVLADETDDGDRIRARLRGGGLTAPELVDVEVPAVLRRHVSAGLLSQERAEKALDDLGAMPIVRASHAPLLQRCWELRENVTPYDAVYVALAESLGVTLLTGDARLARAPGPRCEIEVLRSEG